MHRAGDRGVVDQRRPGRPQLVDAVPPSTAVEGVEAGVELAVREPPVEGRVARVEHRGRRSCPSGWPWRPRPRTPPGRRCSGRRPRRRCPWAAKGSPGPPGPTLAEGPRLHARGTPRAGRSVEGDGRQRGVDLADEHVPEAVAADHDVEAERPAVHEEEPLAPGLPADATLQVVGVEVVGLQRPRDALAHEQRGVGLGGVVLEQRDEHRARFHQLHRATAEVAADGRQGEVGDVGDRRHDLADTLRRHDPGIGAAGVDLGVPAGRRGDADPVGLQAWPWSSSARPARVGGAAGDGVGLWQGGVVATHQLVGVEARVAGADAGGQEVVVGAGRPIGAGHAPGRGRAGERRAVEGEAGVGGRLAEQGGDLAPGRGGPLAEHPARGPVDEDEVRVGRHRVLVVGLGRHDRGDPGGGQQGDRRAALGLGALGDDHQAGVAARQAGALAVAERPPEVGAGATAARQERQQGRVPGAHHPGHGGRAGRGHPGDVVGVGGHQALGAAGLGHARPGAQLDGRAHATGGRRRRRDGGALVVVVDPRAQLVEPAQDLGVAAQQADDQHGEQRHHEGEQHDEDGHAVTVRQPISTFSVPGPWSMAKRRPRGGRGRSGSRC